MTIVEGLGDIVEVHGDFAQVLEELKNIKDNASVEKDDDLSKAEEKIRKSLNDAHTLSGLKASVMGKLAKKYFESKGIDVNELKNKIAKKFGYSLFRVFNDSENDTELAFKRFKKIYTNGVLI